MDFCWIGQVDLEHLSEIYDRKRHTILIINSYFELVDLSSKLFFFIQNTCHILYYFLRIIALLNTITKTKILLYIMI